MKLTNFTYQGVLPKVLDNQLSKQGKRMKQSVPQLPFNGVVSDKIKRSNTAKRLSPYMNKKLTFLSHNFSNVSSFNYPYPPPRYPDSYIHPMSRDNMYSPQSNMSYMNQQYDPYREERLRAVKQRLQAGNTALDTSREIRGWTNALNSGVREGRSTVKYLGIKPKEFLSQYEWYKNNS